ncbi:hypothetical protein Tco_0864165 [Tanacetum coccineum]
MQQKKLKPSSIGIVHRTENIRTHFSHLVPFDTQAEEMAQIFRQRIAQAEAMAHADMLKFQPRYSNFLDMAKCGTTCLKTKILRHGQSGVTLNSDVMLGAMTEDLPTESLDLDDIPNVP